MSKADRKSWTRGEKAIVWAMALAVIATAAFAIVEHISMADPVVSVPTPVMPSPNGFDYVVAASRTGSEGWPMPDTSPLGSRSIVAAPDLHDPKIMADAIALVKTNQPAVDALRQALTYPFLTPPVRSFSQPLPYLARFRVMARILSFEANVDAVNGNFDGSARCSLDAVRLGNVIPRGGGIIHALVGIACGAIGRKPLWNEVDRLNAAQARQAAASLLKVDSTNVTLAQTLQEEKWSGEAGLSEIFHHPRWKSELTDLYGMNGNGNVNGNAVTTAQSYLRLAAIGKRQVMDDYIASVDAEIAAAEKPYGTKPASTPTDPLSDQLHFFNGEQLPFKFAYNSVEDRLLATVCALRAYKLDHGAYPQSLSKLVPTYLHSVLLDPFTAGSPLAYRAAHGKYILYSVGPDRKDDGGVAVPNSHGNQYSWLEADTKGDIVAGVNL